jgi:hypothetical protein
MECYICKEEIKDNDLVMRSGNPSHSFCISLPTKLIAKPLNVKKFNTAASGQTKKEKEKVISKNIVREIDIE